MFENVVGGIGSGTGSFPQANRKNKKSRWFFIPIKIHSKVISMFFDFDKTVKPK